MVHITFVTALFAATASLGAPTAYSAGGASIARSPEPFFDKFVEGVTDVVEDAVEVVPDIIEDVGEGAKDVVEDTVDFVGGVADVIAGVNGDCRALDCMSDLGPTSIICGTAALSRYPPAVRTCFVQVLGDLVNPPESCANCVDAIIEGA